MKLNRLSANETVVTTNDYKQVLFSYDTPVAAIIEGVEYKTEVRHSMTTSKHINRFLLDSKTATVKPQQWFNELL